MDPPFLHMNERILEFRDLYFFNYRKIQLYMHACILKLQRRYHKSYHSKYQIQVCMIISRLIIVDINNNIQAVVYHNRYQGDTVPQLWYIHSGQVDTRVGREKERHTQITNQSKIEYKLLLNIPQLCVYSVFIILLKSIQYLDVDMFICLYVYVIQIL